MIVECFPFIGATVKLLSSLHPYAAQSIVDNSSSVTGPSVKSRTDILLEIAHSRDISTDNGGGSEQSVVNDVPIAVVIERLQKKTIIV